MSKIRLLLIVVLAIIALILIGLQQTETQWNKTSQQQDKGTLPNYQSDQMITLAYEPTGQLGYQLVADNVNHFAELKETMFTHPVMTIYDENITPLWLISADTAKLTNNRQLYLMGHVEVNNLSTTSELQKITTTDAFIDLITKNIQSDSQVDLYATQLHSSGNGLQGNLEKKSAEIIGNTLTIYTPVQP